jgi:hypothetical protein
VTGGRRFRDRIRARLASGFALLSLTSAARAAEAPSPEPFRLVWSSSAGCGDSRTFLSELSGRTTLLREARQDEHAITLIVATFLHESGVRGQLTVRKPDGDLTVREVPGSDCQEVESAMALIAALMVDPLAGDPQRAAGQRHSRPLAAAPPPAPTAPRSSWSLRVEQRLTVRTAVAPRASWGQGLGLMITGESSAWRPSVALSAQATRATASAPHGSAELDWAAAQLAACPLGLRPAEPWDLRACGVLQLGRLRGIGFQTGEPARKSILWSSAGLELQARYRVLGPLWLGLEGGFSLPFTRERFYLEPQETLHRVPAWGTNVALGVGLRFF